MNHCLCNGLRYCSSGDWCNGCDDNTFAKLGSGFCELCSTLCLTCLNTETTCSSCYQTHQRDLIGTNCGCKLHYYEISNDPVCKTCHYSCYECSSFER